MAGHFISTVDHTSISMWLNQFQHSFLPPAWAETPQLVSVDAESRTISVTWPFAAKALETELVTWFEKQLADEPALQGYKLVFQQRIATLATKQTTGITGVKNVIVVSSAKGGVGKSTTAVNFALALQQQGAKVGLLDADIYGPSVPLMLGCQDAQPESHDGKHMLPIEAHGLYTHSVGYLVPADDAMVWRGPMASKALTQIINETYWPELDYLVVDMPPGTGDIQLTLAQQFPVTGAIVITTPQDLALADAIKGVNMFEKVDVPVLGVVENMSYHICSNCGHHEAIFGSGGAEKMAASHAVPLLAQLPLHIQIREDIDKGKPTVVASPESEHALIYQMLAGRAASMLYWQGEVVPETISIRTMM